MAKEELPVNSNTKESLRQISATSSTFGTATFGVSTFGASSNQYTKETLPVNSFTPEALVTLIPTT